MRTILYVLIILFLTASSATSLYSAPEILRDSITVGQMLVGITVTIHGTASALTLLALWRRSRFLVPVAIVWGVTVALATGFAPVVFGAAPKAAGLLSGAITALGAGAIIYFFHRTKGIIREVPLS